MPPIDPPTRDDGLEPDDAALVRRSEDGARELKGARASTDMDALWGRIAQEAFGEPDAVEVPAQPAAAQAAADDASQGLSSPGQSVPRRQWRAPGWLGLAAGLLLVAGAATTFVQWDDDTPVATYAMEALDERAGGPASGEIVQRDGATVVELDLSVLPQRPDDSDYELWVLDLDAGEIVSLGPVAPETTTVVVPEAIAVAEFPTLDVSVEPDDGVPTHSGDSVLRGPITVTG